MSVIIIPETAGTGEIGTDSFPFGRIRGSEVVAGDLHLRDDERDAHWVLREEKDRIVVINKKTGQRFRMVLVPIEVSDDTGVEDG